MAKKEVKGLSTAEDMPGGGKRNIVKKATVTLKADGKVVKEVKIPYKIKSDLKGGALDQAVAPIAAELRKRYGDITATVKTWGKSLKGVGKQVAAAGKKVEQKIKKTATSPKEDKDLGYKREGETGKVYKKKKKRYGGKIKAKKYREGGKVSYGSGSTSGFSSKFPGMGE